MVKNLILWVVIALVMMTVFKNFSNPAMSGDITYSQFISDVKTGRIGSVNIEGSSITVIVVMEVVLIHIVLKPITMR